MINNILLVRLRTSVTIRDLPCEKEIHRKHRIHGIEIRVYPCPPWKKNNPQMLNRSETDENPYNICLTSADKTSHQLRHCSASGPPFVFIRVLHGKDIFANSPIRDKNIYGNCWLFMAIADHIPVRLRTNTIHRC